MDEPNIVVTCGKVRVTVHIGLHGFIRTAPSEVPVGEIPNLIAALHTALDVVSAIGRSMGEAT